MLDLSSRALCIQKQQTRIPYEVWRFKVGEKAEACEKQMENLVSSGKAEKTRFSDANYQKS